MSIIYLKMVKPRPLTKGELYNIDKRITEIEIIMSLCDDSFDIDILDNLDKELESMVNRIKNNMELL